MSRVEHQLPLGIKLQDQAIFDSFYVGANSEIVDCLRAPPKPPGGVVWIWGAASTGKSHLLQAVSAEHQNTAYFPLDAMMPLGASVMQGFASYKMLGLDDVDLIAHDAAWERQLFSLFNELVAEHQRMLVVTSTCAPREVDFKLGDLKSRLLSGPVFRLEPLNDEQLLKAIQLRAKRRGLDLPDKTGQFLLSHFQRDMTSLCENLDKLDTASLIQQRRLTIPLVKNTLSL